MRIRKKKWVEPFLEEEHPTYSKQPQHHIANWKKEKSLSSLHVEIGAGKGDYWLEMAKLYPEALWVAIEKDETVAAMAIRKSYQYEVDNASMIIGDAKHTMEWFGEGEIDVLHLNFSDPWPKSGHRNRRLSSAYFLEIYNRLVINNGLIIMKTDNQQLFEFSLVMIGQEAFTLEEVSVDFRRNEHPEDAISEYEQRFIDKNQPIYRAIWRKNG
jgi:tRNA (guanine-N7-)-methyltransferase